MDDPKNKCWYCDGLEKWEGDAPLPAPLRMGDVGLDVKNCGYPGAPTPRFSFQCPVCNLKAELTRLKGLYEKEKSACKILSTQNQPKYTGDVSELAEARELLDLLIDKYAIDKAHHHTCTDSYTGVCDCGYNEVAKYRKVCGKHPMRKAEADIKILRDALVALVGSDDKEGLEQMEALLRLAPIPAEDKAKTIDLVFNSYSNALEIIKSLANE